MIRRGVWKSDGSYNIVIVWVNGADVTTNSDCVDKSALATGEQTKRPLNGG